MSSHTEQSATATDATTVATSANGDTSTTEQASEPIEAAGDAASKTSSDSSKVSSKEAANLGALSSAPGDRRSLNGGIGDLASSFEKMGMESSKASGQADGQRSGRQSGDAGPIGGSTAGQQSLLQRALGRSGMDNSANNNAGGEAGAGGMTPSFHERFLFSEDELEDDSAFVKKYNLNNDDTSFPVLIRRDSQPSLLSASSAALDLAPLAQTPPRFPSRSGDANVSEWPQFASGRIEADGSTVIDGGENVDRNDQLKGRSERNSPRVGAAGAPRSSMHMTTAPGTPLGPSRNQGEAQGAGRGVNAGHFGAHPASGGRMSSQAFGAGSAVRGGDERSRKDVERPRGAQEKESSFFPFDGMDAFGPGGDNKRAGNTNQARYGSYGFENHAAPGADASRGSQGYFEAFAPPPMGKTGAGPKQGGFASAPGNAGGPGSNYGFGVGPEGAPLGPSSTTNAAAAAAAAAAAGNINGLKVPRKGELDTNTPLEDLQGEIFALCKDQHGCRYLQKKLEEGSSTHRDMIFTETFPHFAELMTDPFGNYLCQKMLEFCTDDQRNMIVESVSAELVTISLNMHGTRAVQKTIDCLSTPRQIHSIIMALSMNVVPLIKDLNGNHVIQKCLNRLSSSDNQFIYDAVATHCVEVATHRHGCCVLQRCIDHASDSQRMQLVQEITFHALTLVQDPFGNYVVQYILDLNDARCSEGITRQFVGHVCNLSVQKFSSNVIEKCIRVSDPSIRKQLVEELLNRTRLEKLLRDSFANYVVQTSLDYADPVQRMQLVECIKPILPMIRNTPYGKRIQSKLQRENIDLGPANAGVPYGMLAHQQQQQQLQAMAAMAQRQGPSGDFAAAMGAGPYASGPMHGGSARGYGRGGMMGPPGMYGRGGPMAVSPGGGPQMSGGNAIYGPGSNGTANGRFAGRGGNLQNGPLSSHGMHGQGPPPHMASSNGPIGFPPQQAYAMQSGFAPSAGGSSPFANPYAGPF